MSKKLKKRELHGLTAIHQFLEAATKQSLRRQGFTVYGIVADWPHIVGTVLARFSVPSRIRRSPDGENASLEIKIAAGIGLEFQHFQPQLIERVNQYYGFRAITKLHLRQGFIPPPPETVPDAKPDPPLPPHLHQAIAEIKQRELRQALFDLGGAIYAKKIPHNF